MHSNNAPTSPEANKHHILNHTDKEMMSAETFIASLLEKADIKINGSRPWDIQVHNKSLYLRILRQGTLGLGEAYMEGWWDCDSLDTMICKALRAKLERYISHNIPVLANMAFYMLCNPQTVGRSRIVAEKHYNFSNDMFECMLGPTMNYSCGYWQGADNLDQAQTNKMELICQKLKLEEGMNVLDIGCGWGGLATYMAKNYKVKVTGITVSTEQVAYAKEHSEGLPIEWLLKDYRSLSGTYDRVVSVGMFEHVGRKNYPVFMKTVRRVLKQDGLFLLHTIGGNKKKSGVDPWISKYIFPNGMLPSLTCIAEVAQKNFIMEDWHNFGADYDKTLMAWAKRFEEGRKAGCFSCSDIVDRMFHYYLLTCAGAFRARDIQLWQVVLSPEGLDGGYHCR